MAGVVFVVGNAYPEHWQAALETQFWETTRQVHIETGELLAFWQAGADLLGVCMVSAGTEPASYTDVPRPWSARNGTEYSGAIGWFCWSRTRTRNGVGATWPS